jgi:hypothetical protein
MAAPFLPDSNLFGATQPDGNLQTPFPEAPWAGQMEGGSGNNGILNPEAAANITNEEIIKQIADCKRESEQARDELEPSWRWYEDLYYQRTQNPNKEEWQSQIAVPELWHRIRVAVSMLQGVLLDAPEWFTVDKTNELGDDQVIRFIKKWVDYTQEEAGLIPVLLEMWEEAFLLGTGCLAVDWEESAEMRPHVEEVPLYKTMQEAVMAQMQGQPTTRKQITQTPGFRGRLRVRRVPIWRIFPDPFAKKFEDCKYVLEEMEVDQEDLEEGVAAGIYDSIEDIGEPVRMSSDAPYTQDLDKNSTTATRRRRHLLQEYTGNIYDDEGNLVAKNFCVTIVNERKIIRIGPNPLWSGNTRYVWSTPIAHKDRLWGIPLTESDATVQEEMTTLLNLMLDDVKYAVLGAFQVDEGASDEPTDIEGIEPGKIYRGRGEFIKKMMFNTNINQAWPVMQYLQGLGDKSTQINEFVDGTPTSRGRPSATEVQGKTQAGTAYVHNLARRLESSDIESTLKLIFEHLVQFGGDDSDPRLRDLLQAWGGPQILQDELARFEILDQPFKIKVRGLSTLMNREGLLNRLMEMLEVTQQLGVRPENMAKILYLAFSAMGFDPEQLGFPPDEESYAHQQMMMQMQAAQERGAAPPGSGGARNATPQSSGPTQGQPPSPAEMMGQPQPQGGPTQ